MLQELERMDVRLLVGWVVIRLLHGLGRVLVPLLLEQLGWWLVRLVRHSWCLFHYGP